MIDVVWDMETNDPDDFLTLLLLLGHPQVNLKAITVFPGTPQQIGIVRYALKQFDVDLPIGAYDLNFSKPSVSDWHYEAYGNIEPSYDADSAPEMLIQYCDNQTTLLMGAPLTNLGQAIKLSTERKSPTLNIGRLVVQGGFAGEGVVPPELQLDKFKGLKTCPTHNLITDSKAALAVIAYQNVGKKYFVSKNVCHKVYYDPAMHTRFEAIKHKSRSLELIWHGMDVFLRKVPTGKLLHDPLAACCAIDETIGTWAEVTLYREGNKWGAVLSPDSNTWIIVDYDPEKFFQTLTTV